MSYKRITKTADAYENYVTAEYQKHLNRQKDAEAAVTEMAAAASSCGKGDFISKEPFEAMPDMMDARQLALTAKELFVLDILWFAPDGCLQSDICDRLSATKQTVSAIMKKFLKQGYVSIEESPTDRRNKIVRFTMRASARPVLSLRFFPVSPM